MAKQDNNGGKINTIQFNRKYKLHMVHIYVHTCIYIYIYIYIYVCKYMYEQAKVTTQIMFMHISHLYTFAYGIHICIYTH